MGLFFGFMKNAVTGEEFVAPMEAEERVGAEVLLLRQYPAPAYALLTVYEKRELTRALEQVERWPGVPSKVQPPLEQLLSRVSVQRGKLPPLPQQRVASAPVQAPASAAAAFDSARIEQVRNAVRGTSPEIQALAARLLAAGMGAPVAEAVRAAPVAQPQVQPQASRFGGRMEAEAEVPAVATANRPSLISVLKALKR